MTHGQTIVCVLLIAAIAYMFVWTRKVRHSMQQWHDGWEAHAHGEINQRGIKCHQSFYDGWAARERTMQKHSARLHVTLPD